MTKRFTSLFDAHGRRRWVAALATIVAIGSAPGALAQSMLRFVDAPQAIVDSSTDVASPVIETAQPPTTELRFVRPNQPTAMPGSGPSSPVAVSTIALKSAKPVAVTETFTTATELVSSLEPPVAELRTSAAPTATICPAAKVPVGTELFEIAPEERVSKPRPVVVVPLQPGPVPQNFVASPVKIVPAIAPAAAPVGTELFTTIPAKSWDVPALDYGSALTNAQPQSLVVETRSQPSAMVASRVPASATIKPAPMPVASELFVAMPQPEPPKSQTVAIAPVVKVATQPKLKAESQRAAEALRPQPKPAVPAPAVLPSGTELFPLPPAKAQAQAALELKYSQLPTGGKPSKTQFVAAANPVANTASALSVVAGSAPMPVQKLAPAVVPPITSAAVSTPTHQVVVSQEPNEPNVYNFRFAATEGEGQATLAQNVGPEAVEPATVEPEILPTELATAPCGCHPGGTDMYGCPYLPGQSGTRNLCGVDCGLCGAPCSSTWSDANCIPWSLFGPGEYVGPARPAHVETYYLRVNDFITLTFIESRKKSAEHYRIGVGDRLQIEWLQGAGNAEASLNRELLVQPDGTVTLPLIGEVAASGKTINDFRDEVVKLYSRFQRDPQITVTPVSVNVAVQDVLKAVTSKSASSGQTQDLRVAPDGTIQAAGIGNVYVQGLTIDELRSELEARYAEAYGPGLSISPQLTDRAVSYVFMGGEVKAPGRYTLEGPTTVMQAIAMAGGWNIGGNVRQVVVFRRDENWCLKATKIDVRAPLYGNDPCPMNDVWLRENDLVLVPKTKILCATDMINLYFTRGVYAVFPINYVYDFSQNSGIVPVP